MTYTAQRFVGLVVFTLVSISAVIARAEAPPATPPVVASLVAEETAGAPGRETWIGVRFEIPKEWHLYWSNPGDSGKAPKIEWKVPAGAKVGDVVWPRPERLRAGPLINFGYSERLLLMAPLTVSDGAARVELAANVDWLVCKDVCVPGKAVVKLSLPISTKPELSQHAALFAETRKLLPRPLPAEWRLSADGKENDYRLRIEGTPATSAQFFPAKKNIFENPSQTSAREGGTLAVKLKKSEVAEGAPGSIDGVLVVDGVAYVVEQPVAAGTASLRVILEAILAAFLGGLILNLMPCVFPVLSIKAFSIVESAHGAQKEVRLHGILYTLGVLMSFWALAILLIALRAGGQKLGWGFQLQSPVFIAFLICLLFGLGLSLLGVFEVGGSFTSVGSDLASKGGMAGAFFTGVLATVVATPCTAPFMGTALGFAASQPAAIALAIFTSLGSGLAAPYLALSFTPALGRVIPRPGRWMESFKQFMAFPLFGTIIWLLWVAGLQGGLDVVAKILTGLLLLGLAGWIYGRWRNNFSTGIIALLTGLTIWIAIVGARGEANQAGAEAIKWETYSRAKVAELRAAGKPIFVDFTAAWCVTCKVNERIALSTPEVAMKIKELGVTPLKADWTNSDAEITQALSEFGRNGVPLYVVYPAKAAEEPRILPQILTSQLVVEELTRLK